MVKWWGRVRILLFVVLGFCVGCSGGQDLQPRPTDVCPNPRLVCFRVENASDLSFERFDVEFVGQLESFGPLAAGQLSEYRRVKAAFSYAYTDARAGELRFLLQPIDYLGERPLKPGLYTYRYEAMRFDEPVGTGDWIVDGELTVRLLSDGEGVRP